MTVAKSKRVPKGWEEYFAGMCRLTRQCCEQHLNAEYAELAEYLIAALCRKRPSPLSRGKAETWACAVLYALGQINFLSDKASTPCMTMADLCDYFGVSSSTGGNKAKLVRDALGIRHYDPHWTLPSRLGNSPLYWMIQVGGFVVDARQMPLEIQQHAVERGLIPYVFEPLEEPDVASPETSSDE
jgi:hypothetical protein